MRMASAITMKMASAREIRMGTASVTTMKTASAAGIWTETVSVTIMKTASALRIRTETASVITGKMSLIRRMRHMDLTSAGMDGIIRMVAEADLRMDMDMGMAADKSRASSFGMASAMA